MIEYLIDTSAVIEYRRKNKKAYERFDEADILYLPVVALASFTTALSTHSIHSAL